MRKAKVYVKDSPAGILEEIEKGKLYRFIYDDGYSGEPVSLTMPVEKKSFEFNSFPAFFDGLLPEGVMLDGLLKIKKLDRNDYFGQLMAVGADVVGAVNVAEIK